MRFKCWRSNTDKRLHIIVRDDEHFEMLPQIIRSCGPWFGAHEGLVEELRPTYRAMLVTQGFVVAYSHTSTFKPEL
jgi:hypothetical protein